MKRSIQLVRFGVALLLSSTGCGEDAPPREPVQCPAAAIYDCLGLGKPVATDLETLVFCARWKGKSPGIWPGYGSTLSTYVYEGDVLVEIVSECRYDSPDGLFHIRRTGDGVSSLGWSMDAWQVNPSAPPHAESWAVEIQQGRPTTGAIRFVGQESPGAEWMFAHDADGQLSDFTWTTTSTRTNYEYTWTDGRLDRIDWTFSGFGEPQSDVVTYEYEDGRLVATRAGRFEETHRWEGGLLVETHSVDNEVGEHTIRSEYEEGRLVQQTIEKAGFGPASELFVTYDDQGRVATKELIRYERDYFTGAAE